MLHFAIFKHKKIVATNRYEKVSKAEKVTYKKIKYKYQIFSPKLIHFMKQEY